MVRSGAAGAVVAVTVAVVDDVSEGVDEGLAGTPVETLAVFTGLVSIPLVSLDRSAIPTRTTSRATSATRPVVARREDTFSRPMSADQGADDGGH